LFTDSKKRFWVGSESGGINLLNEKAGDFFEINRALGFTDETIKSISEDSKGNIWISDNNLLYKIRTKKLRTIPAMEVTKSPNNVNTLHDNMNEYVNIVSFNQYLGWYRGTNESCKDMQWVIPYNKPVIISEFGGEALQGLHGDKTQRWNEEYQEELYVQNTQMFNCIEGLAGVLPWILVDFRSPRRQLPNIQDFFNRKGLISDQGIKKKAFYVMKDWYAQKEEEYK